MSVMTDNEIADFITPRIEHTLVGPLVTTADVEVLCREAKQYGFGAVCVNPKHTLQAAELLENSSIIPCCVVGFPLGINTPEIKAAEAEFAVSQGAEEVNMVIALGDLKQNNVERVEREIASVVDAAAGRAVKVIVDGCLLTEREKQEACEAVIVSGARYVEISTGFNVAGPLAEEIRKIKKWVAGRVSIKAAGIVDNARMAADMAAAGADRIGCNAGFLISRLGNST